MAKCMIISYYFLNKVKRVSDSNGREILTSAWVQAKCDKPTPPTRHRLFIQSRLVLFPVSRPDQ